MEQIVHAAALLALAMGVALIGRWGRTSAGHLVPGHLATEDRARRTSTLRRGALACYAAAAVLVGAAVLAVV